jgi:hypothetical protein
VLSTSSLENSTYEWRLRHIWFFKYNYNYNCQILNRPVRLYDNIPCLCYVESARDGCAPDSPTNCSSVSLLMCPLSVGESVAVSVFCARMRSPNQNLRKSECNLAEYVWRTVRRRQWASLPRIGEKCVVPY